MTTKRRACPWSIPNGVRSSEKAASDELHEMAGSFAQPYVEFLADQEKTAEEAPVRDYRLRQLRDLPILRDLLDRAEREAVERARSEGATWEDVGKSLGVSRQAAQMRFGRS